MSATSLFICHQTANCDIFDDISLAEAEIYSKFDEIVGDKAAIYISHRLSSCRFCDEIAVFDQEEIVQIGTHEELLADPNGKYYELWHAQAQYYTKKTA